MKTVEKTNLGYLASGGGSNFGAIHEKIMDGNLRRARSAVILSDDPNAKVLDRAQGYGIPAFHLDVSNNTERNALIVDYFREYEVDMGIGAGYLKLVGSNVLQACKLDVLNIHPGPLYEFGGKGMHGLAVHQAVIDAGLKWSGPTVHLMNEVFDQGLILGHTQVPVLEQDTAPDLAARILPQEHDLFWRVIAQQIERGLHPEA